MPTEPVEIEVDTDLLRRVIDNLIDNAAKYSASDQPIMIVANQAEDILKIEIADYGIGVASEDLQRLFEPFYRTDRSRTRNAGGIGLGLTLSKRIIEAHGGAIDVESSEGKGTTFRIKLPFAKNA